MNALLRFVLELVALGLFGCWAVVSSVGAVRYVGMFGLPLMAAAVWGTFTTPGDPSRGKDGPVRVSGVVRLGLEAAFFGSAIAACYSLSSETWAFSLAVLICLHYALAHARVAWLIRQR